MQTATALRAAAYGRKLVHAPGAVGNTQLQNVIILNTQFLVFDTQFLVFITKFIIFYLDDGPHHSSILQSSIETAAFSVVKGLKTRPF